MGTWLILDMFAGTQLARVLRPFICSPGEKYELFRPRHGNFYENVSHSIGKMIEEGD